MYKTQFKIFQTSIFLKCQFYTIQRFQQGIWTQVIEKCNSCHDKCFDPFVLKCMPLMHGKLWMIPFTQQKILNYQGLRPHIVTYHFLSNTSGLV